MDDTTLSNDGPPKWLQIADRLRAAIQRGDFPPGATLPTEAELNTMFSTSRTTTRAALNTLVQDGLVRRRSGVGSVVLPARFDQPVSLIRGFSEDMESRGLTPGFEVIEADWCLASGEVSHALGLASTDRPFRSVRLLKANDRIMGCSTSYLRPDALDPADPPSAAELEAGSLYEWLNRRRGHKITRGTEYIEAQTASDIFAQHLQIASQAPVLVVTRIAKTEDGLPVEFAIMTYRSDRYRFVVEL